MPSDNCYNPLHWVGLQTTATTHCTEWAFRQLLQPIALSGPSDNCYNPFHWMVAEPKVCSFFAVMVTGVCTPLKATTSFQWITVNYTLYTYIHTHTHHRHFSYIHRQPQSFFFFSFSPTHSYGLNNERRSVGGTKVPLECLLISSCM